MSAQITIGSKVRSYDFAHSKDCFVEGEVINIEFFQGCDHYAILISKRVWDGKEDISMVSDLVYPPVNGTPGFFGSEKTNFVELI